MTPPASDDPAAVLDNAEIRRRLGARIRALREERGLTQEAVAERAGRITYKHVGAIERGLSKASAPSLVRIALGLGVTVGDLFSTITPPPAPPLPQRTITIFRENLVNAIVDAVDRLSNQSEGQPYVEPQDGQPDEQTYELRRSPIPTRGPRKR